MAKLKRFSFSGKSKSAQGDASSAAAGGMVVPAAAAPVTGSSWLGGGPPLIFDDHISRDTAAAAYIETAGDDGDETCAQWCADEEGKALYAAPEQLDDLRRTESEDSGGLDGGSGGGDDDWHGKVVVRGCIGDVCVKVVDDDDDDGVGKGCSAEVRVVLLPLDPSSPQGIIFLKINFDVSFWLATTTCMYCFLSV